MSFLFRECRKDFETSMRTTKEFKSYSDFKQHIENKYGRPIVSIQFISARVDSRNGWKNHYITVNFLGKDRKIPIGVSNSMFLI